MLREDALHNPDRAPDRLARFLLLRGRFREALAIRDPRSASRRPTTPILHQFETVGAPGPRPRGIWPASSASSTRRRRGPRTIARREVRVRSRLPGRGGARPDARSRSWRTCPGTRALVDALMTWRRDGAAAALPTLRRSPGRPGDAESGPPEAASWYRCRVRRRGGRDEAAVGDLRRFQRFYYPLGQLEDRGPIPVACSSRRAVLDGWASRSRPGRHWHGSKTSCHRRTRITRSAPRRGGPASESRRRAEVRSNGIQCRTSEPEGGTRRCQQAPQEARTSNPSAIAWCSGHPGSAT